MIIDHMNVMLIDITTIYFTIAMELHVHPYIDLVVHTRWINKSTTFPSKQE